MASNTKKDKENNALESKRCFVMMPFSDPEEYEPNHFEKVYRQIIEPAIVRAGFEPFRVDQNKISDQIILKIFEGIIECDMAICDLSSNNPNVLYELGLRHAYDKPVVLINDDISKRIFDIQGISIVQYRSARLYDEVIEDQAKITEAINVNSQNKKGYSIVNMLNLLKASYTENNDQSSTDVNTVMLKRILDEVDEIKRNQSINNDFSSPSRRNLTSNALISSYLSQLELTIIDIKTKYDNNSEYDIPDDIKNNAIKLVANVLGFINRNRDELSTLTIKQLTNRVKELSNLLPE